MNWDPLSQHIAAVTKEDAAATFRNASLEPVSSVFTMLCLKCAYDKPTLSESNHKIAVNRD